MASSAPARSTNLVRYVPRLALEWDVHAPDERWRSIDGTMCFVDISGFTTLSERLAERGRVGAEELTEFLNHVFSAMLDLAHARGGSLLKFGGDALLILFEGPDHPLQAASAAVEMRSELRKATPVRTSVGRVPLHMSTGLHTGSVDAFRAGNRHRELVVTGPCASRTTEMERLAGPGEIVISSPLRRLLGATAAADRRGDGWLLRWRAPRVEPSMPIATGAEATDDEARAWIPLALRRLLGGRIDAEHRIACVAFVEFVGTDALVRQHGPAAIADRLHALVSLVQDAAFEEGVTFLGSDVDADGGKLILATGVPLTQHDDEGRILRAVRAVLDSGPEIAVRVGVNRGHVFAGEIGTPFRATYTVMGDTVNLAARLMASAPVGSAFVAPGVLDRSRTMFATTPLAPLVVKGKSEPVNACDLGEETGDRREPDTSILPFVGRVSELSDLVAQMERARSGKGAAVAVVGETGIGKTRLIREAVRALGEIPVIDVRAEPYGRSTPYRPFRDPIRRLLGVERGDQATMADQLEKRLAGLDPALLAWAPLIGDVAHIATQETATSASIEPKFRGERTGDVVIGLLDRITDGPVLIVVEDAHWVDRASASLLARLELAARERPWVVVTSLRAGDDGFRPEPSAVIELGPLPPTDTARLINELTATNPLFPHQVDTLVGHSGGIPLYLEEIIKVVREAGSVVDLPETIDGVVGAKIDSLPPLPRMVLRHSAVLGRSFRITVLQQLIADEDAALDTATRQQLSEFLEQDDGSDRLRFRHSLARDVAYEGLSYRVRRDLHLRAGDIIETMAGTDASSVADTLAIHFSIGGNAEKAWEYARLAGDRAMAVYANVEAAEQYERALAAGRRLGTISARARARLLTNVGDARERAGMFDAALKAYRRAHTLIDDPITRARLLEKRARVYERTGAYTNALASLTRGGRLLEDCRHEDAAAIRAELLSFAATVRQAQERPRLAHRQAIAAAGAADSAGAKRAAARARTVLGSTSLLLGRPDEALSAWRESLDLYKELDDLSGQAAITANLGVVAYYAGDWDRAVELYESGRTAALQAGNVVDAAVAGSNIGEVLVNQGRADEAEPLLRDVARVLRTTGLIDGAIVAEVYLARLLVDEMRLEEASRLLEQIEGDANALGLTGTLYEASLVRARVHLAEGENQRALELLAVCSAAAPEHFRAFLAATAARTEAEALAASGDIDAALGAIERGRAAARDQGLGFEGALLELTASALAKEPAAPEAIQTLHGLGVRRVDGSALDDLVRSHLGRIS